MLNNFGLSGFESQNLYQNYLFIKKAALTFQLQAMGLSYKSHWVN